MKIQIWYGSEFIGDFFLRNDINKNEIKKYIEDNILTLSFIKQYPEILKNKSILFEYDFKHKKCGCEFFESDLIRIIKKINQNSASI